MSGSVVPDEPRPRNGSDSRLETFVTWLLAGVLAVVPAYTAVLGRTSRPIADDFCTAGWLHQFGFFGSQAYWYQHWSGRFSFSLLMTASQLPGFSLTPWMPALHLAGLVAALYWTLGQLSRNAGWHIGSAGRALAAVTIVAWSAAAAPNLYQSFLWHTGLITYALSLILGVVLTGWLARVGRSEVGGGIGSRFLVPFFLSLIAGGLSETYVALQAAVLGLGLLLFAARRAPRARRRLLPPLAAFLGSLTAGTIVWAAPGNSVRQGLMAAPEPWPQVLRDSVYHAYLFAAQVKSHQLGWLALGLAVSFLVGWRLAEGSGHDWGSAKGPLNSSALALNVLIFLPFVVFVSIAVVMAPSAYALGSYPDGRVLLLAQFVLSFGVVLWGVALGLLGLEWVSRWLEMTSLRWLTLMGKLLLLAPSALLVFGFVRNAAPLAASAREFADRWDKRDRALRMAEPSDAPIEAASLTHMGGLAELEPDPDAWINRCVALAYGLPAVAAK